MRHYPRVFRKRRILDAGGVFAILVLAALIGQLRAHTLLITRGSAIIEPGKVALELDVNVEDFIHRYGLGADNDGMIASKAVREAAMRHGDELGDSLFVWDDAGNRLACEPFHFGVQELEFESLPFGEVRKVRLRYTSSCPLPSPCQSLTFRLHQYDQNLSQPAQCLLVVQDSVQSRDLQLTSRGNAETVELDWSDERPCLRTQQRRPGESVACAPFSDRGAARFKEIFVDVDVCKDFVEAKLSVPLPLLETWITLSREHEAQVLPMEQLSMAKAVRTLAESALQVEVGGSRLAHEPMQIRVLGLGPTDEFPAEATPLGFFTSRVEVVSRFPLGRPVQELSLRWNLWNGVVLNAQAAIRSGNVCKAGEFSTYLPVVHWHSDFTSGTIESSVGDSGPPPPK